MYIAALKTKYKDEIVAALMKEFGYSSIMQVPRLEKIVINQGVGKPLLIKNFSNMVLKRCRILQDKKPF